VLRAERGIYDSTGEPHAPPAPLEMEAVVKEGDRGPRRRRAGRLCILLCIGGNRQEAKTGVQGRHDDPSEDWLIGVARHVVDPHEPVLRLVELAPVHARLGFLPFLLAD